MDDRRKDIRDRIERRKKMNERKLNGAWTYIDDPDGDDNLSYSTYETESEHPLFKKEYFFFKILASIVLFLIVAVIFKHPSQQLDTTRNYVTKTMNQDFQFASISSWYESTFGKPIAFLPQKEEPTKTVG